MPLLVGGGGRAIAATYLADVTINELLMSTEGVYTTPTVDSAVRVIQAGAAVVAVDATSRPRPDGSQITLQFVLRAN